MAQIKYDIVADHSKFSSGLNAAGSSLSQFGARFKSAWGGIGSMLENSPMGQTLGPLTQSFQGLGSAMDGIKEHGARVGTIMTAAGGGILGASSALMAFGSADQAAQNQLSQAYQNIGSNIGDFQGRIDSTVQSMTRYGYTADEVKNSLTQTVQATHSGTAGFNLLGTAANLAASRHISLEQATTQVIAILAGKGTKTLVQYGISTKGVATATTVLAAEGIKHATVAQKEAATVKAAAENQNLYKQRLKEVSDLTKGQASASANTFSGKLHQIRAEVINAVASFATKYGPTIQMASAATMVMGGILDTGGSLMRMFSSSAGEASAATDVLAGSADAAGASEDVMAAGATATDVALAPVIATVAAIVAGIALLGIGIYELVTHWKTVWGVMKSVVLDAWHFFDNTFIQPLKTFFSTIVDFIRSHWQMLLEILMGPVGLAIMAWQHFHDAIIGFFVDIWHFVEGVWQDMTTGVLHVVNNIVSFFASIPGRIVSALTGSAQAAVGNAILNLIPGWARGFLGLTTPSATLGSGTIAFLKAHPGYTPSSTPSITPHPGKSGAHDVTGSSQGDVYLDGQKVGVVVAPHVRNTLLGGTARNARKVGLG